ncbi:hypothetical protein FACS1894140_4380 [Spirochaetia bacterium]|nr:hypothetical protein FACS1894140_4380 [Spirochaetia bacterium]
MKIQTFILLTVLALSSCDRKDENLSVIPPATPPLSRQLIGYGVINVSYTHVVEEAESSSASLGYLRRGSIVKILERRPVKRTVGRTEIVESWVLVEGNFRGWLPEPVVDIYDSENRARTAAGSMIQ